MTHDVRKIRKAVFPVAGLGTRFLPATKVMPKEMLTIVDRPLMQMAVEEAKAAGIEEFIFVVSTGKEILAEHFGKTEKLLATLESRNKVEQIAKVKDATLPEGSLKIAYQDEPLGLGHAVWCARDLVGNEPFAVILTDDTVRHPKSCLAQMIEAYNGLGGNMVATCAVPPEDTNKYGILDVIERKGDVVTLKGLVEKPKPEDAPSDMSIFGRYILQPQIFDHLAKKERGAGGEIQLTDAMAHLLKEQPFYGFEFKGERLDCGMESGFIKSQIAYGLDQPRLKDDLISYMKNKLKEYGA